MPAEHRSRLDEVSRIELGFPYELLRGPQGQMVYGDLEPRIDLPPAAPIRWSSGPGASGDSGKVAPPCPSGPAPPCAISTPRPARRPGSASAPTSASGCRRRGERWTTADKLVAAGHRGDVREVEPDLLEVGVDPPVAIGQRALVVRTPEGNLLWDPPGHLDEAAVAAVRDAGGLRAVAASHPTSTGRSPTGARPSTPRCWSANPTWAG